MIRYSSAISCQDDATLHLQVGDHGLASEIDADFSPKVAFSAFSLKNKAFVKNRDFGP
jgi:hypothetical protein